MDERKALPAASGNCKHCFSVLEVYLLNSTIVTAKGERQREGKLAICPYCDHLEGDPAPQPNHGKNSYLCISSGISWPRQADYLLCPFCLEETRPSNVKPIGIANAKKWANWARWGWYQYFEDYPGFVKNNDKK